MPLFQPTYPYITAHYMTGTYSASTDTNGFVTYKPVQLEVKVFKINATQSATITYDNSLRNLSSIVSYVVV